MSWEENATFDEDTMSMRLSLALDEETLRLYWVAKDGQKIYVEDMATSHIESIIRANEAGKLNCDDRTINRFLLELSIRRRIR